MFCAGRAVLGQWRADMADAELQPLPKSLSMQNQSLGDCQQVQLEDSEDPMLALVTAKGMLEWWCSYSFSKVARSSSAPS